MCKWYFDEPQTRLCSDCCIKRVLCSQPCRAMSGPTKWSCVNDILWPWWSTRECNSSWMGGISGYLLESVSAAFNCRDYDIVTNNATHAHTHSYDQWKKKTPTNLTCMFLDCVPKQTCKLYIERPLVASEPGTFLLWGVSAVVKPPSHKTKFNSSQFLYLSSASIKAFSILN